MIQDYIAIDVETTGLNPEKDKLIEIAAVVMRDGVCIDSFTKLIKQSEALEDRIIDLTKITDAMLENADDEITVIQEFSQFINRFRNNAYDSIQIIGNNVMFDFKFLKVAFVKYAMDFS